MGTVSVVEFLSTTNSSSPSVTLASATTAGDVVFVAIQGRSGGVTPTVSQTSASFTKHTDIVTGTFDSGHRRSLTVWTAKYAGGENQTIDCTLSTGTVYMQVWVLRGLEGDFLDNTDNHNGNTSDATTGDTGQTASQSGNTAAIVIATVKTGGTTTTISIDNYNDFTELHDTGSAFIMQTAWAVESFTTAATRGDDITMGGAAGNDGYCAAVIVWDRDAGGAPPAATTINLTLLGTG